MFLYQEQEKMFLEEISGRTIGLASDEEENILFPQFGPISDDTAHE